MNDVKLSFNNVHRPGPKKDFHRQNRSCFLSSLVQVTGCTLLFSQLLFIPAVHAGPSGGDIVGGSGSIKQSGLTTTIKQNSSALAINWNSFDLKANEVVNYLQPGASSIALNRILGSNASQIHGQINANGRVVLVNPNGLFFSPTASINVGGLIASGLDISPLDFMNGDYVFSAIDGTDGAVINSGILNASLGGSISLLGQQVTNEGLISASLGAVNLAAGKEAVVTFDNEGLIGVHITKEVLQDELGVEPAVLNNGEIKAEAGRILLTTSQSQELFSRAVNSGGIEQATSVVVHEDGSFTLGAGADVVNTGSIDVSSSGSNQHAGQAVLLGENITSSGSIKADSSNGNGGDIELHSTDTTQLTGNAVISSRSEQNGDGGKIRILGDKVGLFDQSVVDASGASGGGEILIGGDQEGLNPRIRNAEFIYLAEQSQVKVDALVDGDGGRLITFAEDTARIHGDLYARGGEKSGQGGFIETSGLKGFEILKTPDITAPNGQHGEWLIDPNNITIVGGGGSNNIDTVTSPFTSTDDGASLGVDLIVGALTGGATVTITTASAGANLELGNITFFTNLDYDGTGNNTLTLNAANNIDITNQSIRDNDTGSGTDSLNINLNAGNNVIIDDSDIETNGGAFSASGVDFTYNRSGGSPGNTINTSGGNVTLNMTGAIDINSEIITEGGNFTVTNAGSFDNNHANGDIDTSDTDTGGAININSAGDVILGDMDVNGSTVGGLISITAGNDITLSQQYDFHNTHTNTLTFNAANDININAQIFDNSEGTRDTLDIVLNADTDAVATGSVNINADVYTGGGNFTASGIVFDSTGAIVNTNFSNSTGDSTSTTGGNVSLTMTGAVTLGSVVTESEAASNGDLTIVAGGAVTDASGSLDINGKTRITAGLNNVVLDNANNFSGNVRIISANDVTLNDVNGIALGDAEGISTVSNALIVTAGDNITDNGALDVTGTTSISTLNNNITLDEASHNLQGAISLTTTGTNGNDTILLNNSASETILGTVSSNGALTINAQGDLTLNSSVTTVNESGNDTVTANLNFGLDNVAGHVMTLNNGASIVTSTNNGETANVNINGNDAGSTFVFATGSSVTLDNSGSGVSNLTVNGGNGIDTFDVQMGLPATINGAAGNDILNGSNNANDWAVTAANAGSLTSSAVTTSFTGIERLNGGTGTDTLNGPNQDVTWTIGAGSGNLSNGLNLLGTGFFNFESYVGGNADDTFNVQAAGTFTRIDGGNENNRDIVDVSTRALNSIIIGTDIVDIERVIGNDSNSTLIAENLDNDWTITGNNDGTVDNSNGIVEFVDFNNITGNDGRDIFTFEPSGAITGVIDAAGGSNDTVNYSNVGIVDISLVNAFSGVTNAETIRGNNGNSTLRGLNVDSTWTITGDNDGTVAGINFEDFNNLVGGSADDDFVFNSGGSISGLITGGTATTVDTVDMSAVGGVIDVVLGQDISGIETITGNNNGTLTGLNVDNTWNITGVNDGDVGGVDFFDFNNLTGGSADDDFIYAVGGSLSGLINGGSQSIEDTIDGSAVVAGFDITLGSGFINIEQVTGNNTNSTLTALNVDNTWNITGTNSGNVGGIDFIGFNNLTGGSADDDFIFTASGVVSGLINGGNANTVDTLDQSSLATVNVALGQNVSDIEVITGNNIDSTLTGLDVDNTWNITGVNDGDVGGVNFFDFNNLTGGTADDDFVYAVGGSLAGLIDGGNASTIDTIDGSALGEFNITLGSGFTNIEQIVGNNINSILTALNINNLWNITGVNDGDVGGINFIDFNNLNGGSANDSFVFTASGAVEGLISGGNAITIDTVDMSAVATIDVTLEQDITGIESITGNNTDSTLTALNVDNTWNITGGNDGNVSGVTFVDFNNLTGGAADDDFIYAAGSSVSGLIDGGSQNAMDTIDGSAVVGGFDITLGTGFINIEQVTGNNTNSTLTAQDINNTWNITGTNSGDVAGIDFIGFNNLTGGSDDDVFMFFDTASVSGTISGGNQANFDILNFSNMTLVDIQLASIFANTTGIEQLIGNNINSTLSGQNQLNTWSIDGVNDGSYLGGADSIDFFDFNNLVGGSLADDFILTAAGEVSGLVDGAGGGDSYDASALAGPVLVRLVIDVANIETITGNNANSTFVSSDTFNVWNINTPNDGVVAGVSFINFNNITGGSDDDIFIFAAGASIDGIIDGGDQFSSDIVSYANIAGFALDLGNPVNTATGIEVVIGNNVDSTIIAENQGNNWSITGDNDGTISNAGGSIEYLDFVNFVGGNQDDDFVFTASGAVAGQIDGGAGTNSVDYSALASAVVELDPAAANSIVNIESITGNNLDSTINAADNLNAWTLSGNNDGVVNGILFTDFNVLNGGSLQDIFNVQVAGTIGDQANPDADLVSVVNGLGGDDIFNMTLDGNNNGSIKFNGGTDSNTVNFIGGNAGYAGDYESNVAGGYDRITYSLAINSIAVNFTQVASVQDDTIAASLTVNGTSLDDTIELNSAGADNFTLNALTQIDYSGKDDLLINASTGNDVINITSNVNLPGLLSLSAETVNNTAAVTISADTLLLDSVTMAGAAGAEILTDIVNLEIANASGDVFIRESNGINISQFSTIGAFTLHTLAGNVTDSTGLNSSANFNVTADLGSILLDDANQLSGELSLVAANGNVTLNNNSNTQLATVTTQNLAVTSAGDITQSTSSVITATASSNFDATGQDIVLDNAGQQFTDLTVTDAVNLTLVDSFASGLTVSNVNVSDAADVDVQGNIQLNTLSAGNVVNLNTTGSVNDANGTAANISGNTLRIRAVTGIGDSNQIETAVQVMDMVNSGDGSIRVQQSGDVEIVNLRATFDGQEIDFRTDQDVSLNPGSVAVSRDSGSLFMSTSVGGSFLGLGSFDLNNADITANSATFLALTGTFGTTGRPIVIDIPKSGSLFVDARTTSIQYFPERPDNLITTGIDISSLGVVSAIAGEQLVEIESLGEIDPAIFTELRNYSVQDVSIRMPRDQLFEDELEEEEQLSQAF